MALPDAFDALTHEKPYKSAWPVLAWLVLAWPVEEAIAETARRSGSQFDPNVVRGLLAFADGSFLKHSLKLSSEAALFQTRFTNP